MKIMVVDDNSNNRYYLEQLLKNGGFKTVSASNGAEAIKIALLEQPGLIISDILMPEMDGFEMCRRLKSDGKLKKIPLIIYTATYTEPEDEKLALDLGADMFLVKPKQPEELLISVNELLNQENNVKNEAGTGKNGDEMLDRYNKVLFQKLNQKIKMLEDEVVKRTKAEERLSLAVAALKKSNADLQNFTDAASHDLQEPLRTVSHYVQLLKHKYTGKLDNEADAYIETAVKGAVRMSDLIKSMINYLEVDTVKRDAGTVNSGAVIEEVREGFKNQLEEKSGTMVIGGLVPVRGEKEKLERIFHNLVDNAIKFSKKGEPPEIGISCEKGEKTAVFCVRDNGIGISPVYFNKIFVIFQKLHPKDEYEGNGIGLSECKKLVESMGGDMWVESEEGKGAAFFFTLPAA